MSNLQASKNNRGTIPGTKNFVWGEVTRNGARPLPNEEVANRAVAIARILQEIRDKVGKPIHITSWYRDPATNKAVGGVSNSRHIYGDAVDIYVDGMSNKALYDLCDRIVGNRGGVGVYSHNEIVHVDARGYKARW